MKPKLLTNSHIKREQKKPTHMIPSLTAGIGVSFAVALYTVSNLDWEDRVTISRGLFLSLLGAVFFTSIYSLFNQTALRTVFGQKVIKKYKLSTADVLDTSNKVVSTVQALLSCLSGFTITSYSCPRDLLRTSHYISEAYAWFGASYFMYDIWSMYQVHCHSIGASGSGCQQNGDVKKRPDGFNKFVMYIKDNPVIIGHHLFIGCFGFSVIVYLRGGLGDCVFGYVFLMEASTPFVSMRSVLSRFGLKSTKMYVVNGVLMLLSFFLCRIVMFPYVMYLYAQSAKLDYIAAIMSLPRACKITMSILVLPQLYWFFLMLRGATKMLGQSKAVPVAANTKKRKNSHLNSPLKW